MSETTATGALPRVLIVDDSRMVRASIVRHIRERYEVREEADGESGWETLLLDPSVQVVISDLTMPKLDGFGLLERIRSSKINRIKDIPVIIISGDEEDSVRAKAKQAGATDFITKGIGTVELLARLDALIKLAKTGRELRESREALARHSPIDPKYGLVTADYFRLHGSQALSAAKRHYGEVNVMVIDIDRFPAIMQRYGEDVANLILRKMAKILTTRVRKEDSVTHMGGSRFAVVSPSISLEACSAFALRLREAIGGTQLNYRGEAIHISLSLGLTNSPADTAASFEDMVKTALHRVDQAKKEGGNRVMTARGVITEPVPLAEIFSIERALLLLGQNRRDDVKPHLTGLIRRLLPLFQQIEEEFSCGLPMPALEQCSRDDDDEDLRLGRFLKD